MINFFVCDRGVKRENRQIKIQSHLEVADLGSLVDTVWLSFEVAWSRLVSNVFASAARQLDSAELQHPLRAFLG